MKKKEVQLIPVSEILLGENPRQDFDATALAELMQSMKHNGLLMPIGVRVLPTTGKFKLVFGHRRLIAAQRLGWDKIEAVTIEVTDEKDALLKTSTENVIRENVSMPEQGRIFTLLVKKGLTADQIRVRMGCSKKFVFDAMEAYNRIPKKYHDMITYGTRGRMKKEGQIPATVALKAIDVQKKTKLTNDQVGKLMDWASKHQVSAGKMKSAGKMLAAGMEPSKAFKKVTSMRTVSVQITMKIDVINHLQAKHKKTINEILYAYFEKNKEFQILPIKLERYGGAERVEGAVRVRKNKGRNK